MATPKDWTVERETSYRIHVTPTVTAIIEC
jgi:hypothetical protein